MNEKVLGNRGLQSVTCVSVLALCALSLVAFSRGAAGYSASTPQTERRVSQPKWEYCAITGIGTVEKGLRYVPSAQVSYFTSAGTRRESIEGGENQPVAAAIAKLGMEGWEMVGESTFDFRGTETPSPGVLYFKRPTQ